MAECWDLKIIYRKLKQIVLRCLLRKIRIISIMFFLMHMYSVFQING